MMPRQAQKIHHLVFAISYASCQRASGQIHFTTMVLGATYAVQVEGLPVDLVAEWLKQKNLDTTRYYSRPTQEMVASEHDAFVDRLATKINIREAILRSPEELRKQAEDARKRIGTLVSVVGGECTLDAYCPEQLGNCIHCPAKVPDPAKHYQV